MSDTAMMNAQQAIRVGISGSYGGLNLGDEAILEAIITQSAGYPAAPSSRARGARAADDADGGARRDRTA